MTFEKKSKIDNKWQKLLTFENYRKVLTNNNNLPLGKNKFFLDFLKFSALGKNKKAYPYVLILAVYRVKSKKIILKKQKTDPYVLILAESGGESEQNLALK